MPTYEFECPVGHQFDKFYRKISDAPGEVPCQQCGQTAQRRISAGAGLLFKGSGFYITDYGKDGKKQPAAPTSTDAPPTSGSGADTQSAGGGKGAESESKPAESKGTPADKGSARDKSSGSAE